MANVTYVGYDNDGLDDEDQGVDALIRGYKWTSPNITFSFPDQQSDYGSNYSDNALETFFSLTSLQKTAARAALNNYASVSNLNFTELTGNDDGNATLRFAQSNGPATAYAYYPSSADLGGDSWYGTNYNYTNAKVGTYAYHTIMHEIGHALGLKHGQETTYGGAIPYAQDSMEYSIMTYKSYVGDNNTGYNNASDSYAQSLMMLDIAAIQRLYGADFNAHSGDTTYTFSTSSGQMFIDGQSTLEPGHPKTGNKIFRTIWDGDGNDTYDFSNFSKDTVIDLSAGGYVDLDTSGNAQRANLGNGHYARGHVFNALQYEGDTRSLIENAIGGSADDIIYGNAADNILEGRAGDDTLEGFAGNDTLDGGSGNDTAWFDGLLSDFSFAFNNLYDVTVEALFTLDLGIDTVLNTEWFQFNDVLTSATTLFNEFGQVTPVDSVISLDDGVTINGLSDSNNINTGDYLQKTHAMAFETGNNVTNAQVIYEQGGATRGLNMFIKNGSLYGAVWNKAEENWGYKEIAVDIEANTKYTATLVMDGSLPANGSAELYLNGALVGEVNGIGKLYGHSDDIGIGQIQGGTLIQNANVTSSTAFQGSIEKITQFNDVLGQSQFNLLQNDLAEDWLGTGDPYVNPEQIIMEFGSIDTDHNLVTVQLEHAFENPVVFVTMTTFNGGQIAVPRITNVQDDSFMLYAQEADYLDGTHLVESFSYIVVEKGSWTLSDGTLLEVGTLGTSNLYMNDWQNVGFQSEFNETPAVFTQVQTYNNSLGGTQGGDTSFASTRQDDADTDGFNVGLQEEELTNTGSHGYETIGWFAIETGAGTDDGHDFYAKTTSDSYTHEWEDIVFNDHLDELPQLLASISSTDGTDSAVVRADNLTANSVSVQVQEDQSKDSELNHTSETFDIFAIEGYGQLTGTQTDII